MSDRKALLFCMGFRPAIFEQLEYHLGRGGVSLAHPTRHSVVFYDCEGEAYDGTRGELVRRLEGDDTIRFSWWSSGCSNLYCELRMCGALVAVELGLDGYDSADAFMLCLTWEQVFVEMGDRSRMLILDPDGVSEDIDWDDVICGNLVLDMNGWDKRPRLIVFRRTYLSKFRNTNHVPLSERGSDMLEIRG